MVERPDLNAPSSRARFSAFRQRFKKRKGRSKAQDDEARDGSGQRRALAGEVSWEDRETLRTDKETRRRYLKRYYSWLRPYWGQLFTLLVAGLVISALDIAIPSIVGQMVDLVSGKARLQHWFPQLAPYGTATLLAICAGAGLVVILLARFVGLWRSLATQKLNAQVTHRLRSQLHEHILRLPLGDLHEMKSGGVVSRLSTDVDGTIGLVQQAVLSPLQALLRLLFVSVYLFYLSWQVTLVSLTMLIGVGLIYHLMLRRVRPVYRSMGEDRQRVSARVTETFGGVRVVRSFAREFHEQLAYGVGHHTIIRKQLWVRALQSFLLLFWEMLLPLTSLVIVAMGCVLIEGGDDSFTIGDIFQFQMLTFMVLNPVFMIVQSMTETQRSLASMERVYEVLERQPEKPDRPDARPAPKQVADICVEDLSFAYGQEDKAKTEATAEAKSQSEPDEDAQRLVLRHINLQVPGGSVVAFVGPSGAGKTTLTDLLARFHDPVDGRITLNGVDLRDYRLADYRQLLGIVQQEVFLFDGTIRDNIAYGYRQASDAEVREAARRANALEFIDELPDGFDALIGERGVKLSGGQRQRLSIARAILADPRILILDEATSNLDSESEQLIQASLKELFKGRTTFVVAHRLSTIRDADMIVVIEDGEIIQQGRHAELMAAGVGTAYYDMVERQRLAE